MEAAKQIYEMYSKMDARQREAFLLGRIAALLDFGNGMSDSVNKNLRATEKTLKEVQDEIAGKPKRRRRSVKKVNKDEE